MPRPLWAALLRLAPELAPWFGDPGNTRLGELGEALATRWLRRRGYRIVARRLLTRWAEVDLVACDGDLLVCVEVKTARWTAGSEAPDPRWRPGARLDAPSLARLRRAAEALSRARGQARSAPGRVDLIEVWVTPGSRGARRIQLHRDLCRPL